MPGALDAVIRRDRAVLLTALAVLTALAWAYLLWMGAGAGMRAEPTLSGMMMPGMEMPSMAMPGALAPEVRSIGGVEVAFVFAMWAVMMVGMMTPSAAPMVLLYAAVGRQASAQGKPLAATGWFMAGYFVAWTLFAVAATATQLALTRATLLNPMLASANDVFGGAVLIAAGVYQWTPLKDKCLTKCRSPLVFIQQHGGFRRDPGGSVLLGFRHGTYCVGCCWMLMALLFVGGVINVLWIAVLSVLVLAEKALPYGRLLSRTVGVILAAVGAWLIVS